MDYFLGIFRKRAGATEEKLGGRSRQVGVAIMLQAHVRDVCLNTRCNDQNSHCFLMSLLLNVPRIDYDHFLPDTFYV
jgi:hypothetical protein